MQVCGLGQKGKNMGKKTKIDWCDASWNPVTGCLHGCEYCYAKRIAERFGGGWRHQSEPADKSWRHWRQSNDDLSRDLLGDWAYHANRQNHVLNEQCYSYPCCPIPEYTKENDPCRKKAPYPYFFDPTFHRYKLDEPLHWKKPRSIFVCSMADLFGEWVPEEWIAEVFQACEAAPWHRYLFLTKNGKRYKELYEKGIMPMGMHAWNKWFGCTVEKETDEFFINNLYGNGIDHQGFLSIEPMLSDFEPGVIDQDATGIKWVIVGAETGNRKGKVVPQRAWVEHIAQTCKESGIPLFMKDSLRELMGDDFRQEFPWEDE